MALLFLEGFDKYGPANSNGTNVAALVTAGDWTAASAADCGIVAPLSATGQAYRAGSTILTKTLGANYSRLIGGCRFSSNLASAAMGGIQFFDAGVAQCTISINQAGTISLRNNEIYGTVIATSSASVTASSVHYLEWDISFGSSAAYQVWLDGVSVFSGTGNTTGIGSTIANRFGVMAQSTGTLFIVDDIYLFDSTGSSLNAVLLNSPRVETTFPASDSAVQFSAGAGILGSSVARTAVGDFAFGGYLTLRRFTPTVACTLASISFVSLQTNSTANYRGVVYADSGGAAGTLMSSGTQVTGVTNGVAKVMPLTTPQSLAAGTQYWLGFIADSTVQAALLDATAVGYIATNTYASGAPGTAPAMTSGQPTYLLWGNLTGITGNNWYAVSQQPAPGISSYVYEFNVGNEDLYNFPALSAPAAVHAVALKGYCQRSDSGARTVSLRTKSGATDGGGSATGQTPGTTFGWLASYFPTDPNTSAAWTGAALNAATSGFKVDS